MLKLDSGSDQRLGVRFVDEPSVGVASEKGSFRLWKVSSTWYDSIARDLPGKWRKVWKRKLGQRQCRRCQEWKWKLIAWRP